MSRADDVRLAGELVREAGRLAQSMRRGGLETEHKTSISDVVTAADRAAERLITDRLAAERPGDGVLGEEGSAAPSATGRRWIIDPVDGTYNFVSGLSWWCSALALVDGDDLVLGAVYHPHDDVLFVGGPELPTTRNGEPVAGVEDVALGHACAATYLHPAQLVDPVGQAWVGALSDAATIRMLGSGSMDLAAVSQGRLHLYIGQSVPEWDRLPGAGLVLGAGGEVAQVESGGALWSLAGSPTAVAEVCARLAGE